MLISDSNANLTKLNENSIKEEGRSTFDKSNPIYNKEKGTSTIRRNSKNSKGSKNSKKHINSNQDVSAKSKEGSGSNIDKINKDLKNINEQIEVDVRVGDQHILNDKLIDGEKGIIGRAKPPRDRKRLKSAGLLGRSLNAPPTKKENTKRATNASNKSESLNDVEAKQRSMVNQSRAKTTQIRKSHSKLSSGRVSE